MPAPTAVARPTNSAVCEPDSGGEDRGQRRQRAVDEADESRLDEAQHERALVLVA
jgi:hypothetical protein